MKAWLLDDFTGLERLRLAEVPDPVPQPGEALLEVHYAALNPADRYLAERQYPAKPSLPHILGRDGMGTVIRVGPGVGGLRPGDRRAILRGDVGGNRPGTFAQRVAVPAQDLVEIPAGWSEPEAAGAALVCLTAYQALTIWGPLPDPAAQPSSPSLAWMPHATHGTPRSRGPGILPALPNREDRRGSHQPLRPGQCEISSHGPAAPATVLITGASGGVGVAAVQLAAALGHTVLALSRNPEKSERLRQLGASAVFNPADPQWRQAVKAALAPRRVDLAIDSIGGALLPGVIDTLGDLGKVSLVGRLAGPVPSFNTATLFFRRLRLGGVAVGAYSHAETLAAWQHVLRLFARTGARPQVDCVVPFDQLPKAFDRLAQGPLGKVVLHVLGELG